MTEVFVLKALTLCALLQVRIKMGHPNLDQYFHAVESNKVHGDAQLVRVGIENNQGRDLPLCIWIEIDCPDIL